MSLAVALSAAPALGQEQPPPQSNDPLQALVGPNGKPARYVPKPAGTREVSKLWFGPYVVPPGQDMNRIDVDIPLRDGYLVSIEPTMHRTADLSVPSHQEAHIHHAHWFALDPGNKEDNYTYGNTEWIFGNGDEETKANFEERSAADPNGPNYGEYVGASGPQLMIYMLHNKTNQPLNTWIVLDVTFVHGTKAELDKAGPKPWHDVSGVLFGRTFDVPRQPEGDGKFNTTDDMPKPITWTSTIEGTIVGTGSHLHPGGIRVVTSNLGSEQNPCPDDGKGFGGTTLLQADTLFHYGALFSEDYQTEVTNPAWRAPLHKGDRLQITGIYENKDHAWYTVMTHNGFYIDEAQPPQGRCKPYFVGGVKEQKVVKKRFKKSVRYRINAKGKLVRKVKWGTKRKKVGVNLIAGVPNREWGHDHDTLCGLQYGKPECDRPAQPREVGDFTNQVLIADFLYVPGDTSLSGDAGKVPRVRKGESLTFVNVDQAANIRHTVTTCELPCNGAYVANYPWANGAWDSGIMGYDVIDGGSPSPTSSTPTDLAVGRHAYFCRIHPWMRGQFEVAEG